jgi:hypothetical protein
MLQRTNATTKFLSIKSGCYNEHRCYSERCYNERMLQRTVLSKKQDATTNTDVTKKECYNVQFYQKSRMLQRTQMLQRKNATTYSFINKIRVIQRTRMQQRTQRNTIGRRSTRVRMTCRAFPLWLERQSSSLLSFVWFSYQFSSVICLFVQCIKVK